MPIEQRKLAAILCVDVVGFSRLMGEDEAGTLANLKAHRNATDPCIYNHGGRIVNTAGDGMLVEFPSVVAAVETAVEVQRIMAERNATLPDDRRMLSRIGIHLGDVIVEGDDLYGDGINIAARLQEIAEPGGISISGTVRDNVHRKLDITLVDLGAQDLKNIAEPLLVWRVDMGLSRTEALASAASQGDSGRSAVAVLRFDNMTDDSEQEYFADGIAEDIITSLSLVPGLKVIARNSTFALKGQALDVKLIARQVDARYVLEGSVRRAGNRVRITAQLIDATTGQHMWAERYDRELADIFEVQDEITQSIVGRVAPEIVRAEGRRVFVRKVSDLNAWELYLRARHHSYQGGKDGNAEALRLCQEAMEIDPDFAPPYALFSWQSWFRIFMGWRKGTREIWHEVLRTAETATRLNENDPLAVSSLAVAYMWSGRHDEAIALAERSIAINPSLPMLYMVSGSCMFVGGRHAEAIEALLESLRRGPNDPDRFHAVVSLAYAHYAMKQYDIALSWADRGLRLWPDHVQGHGVRTAALAQLGRRSEARESLERYLIDIPDTTASQHVKNFRWRNAHDIDQFKEGLVKAGLPE